MRNALLLLLACSSIRALSEPTFQKLFGLIKIDNMNITKIFQENSRKTVAYNCVVNNFKRRLLRESEVSFDAGFDGCGWEIASLHFLCKNKSVRNLWAETRRVPSPSITKTTSMISEEKTDKNVDVPVGRYIKTISTGYIFDGDSQYVSQLIVTLDDNKSIDLKCAQGEVYVKTEAGVNKRIDGIQMVLDKEGRFSFVDFHTHEIVPVSSSKSKSRSRSKSKKRSDSKGPDDYLDFFRDRNLKLSRLEDDFYLRGPIGLNDGTYFIDQKYYSDWQLSSVRIEADNKKIYSIQLVLTHTIFDKKVHTQVQGREKRNAELTKTLVIPRGQHLSLARFYIDDTESLTGIKLSIYNGDESDCFGLCPTYKTPKETAEFTKTMYFSNKDNIVGLFGYKDASGVNSLGFLLNIKRGTEGLYFVTDDSSV